jgi:hypothetical protein
VWTAKQLHRHQREKTFIWAGANAMQGAFKQSTNNEITRLREPQSRSERQFIRIAELQKDANSDQKIKNQV